MNKPIFIIVCGPCGSGKSSLPKKICNYLNINYNTLNFENILIDNLIEQDIYYKRNVYNIIKSYNCNINQKIIEDPLFQRKMNKLYYKTRQNKNYDFLNEYNLYNALVKRKNIIFETQGTNSNDWLFNNYYNELKDYEIIMSWSIINFNQTVNRIQSRFLNSINKFKNNHLLYHAPRLPNMSENYILLKNIKIIDSFYSMTRDKFNKSKLNKRYILINNNNNANNDKKSILFDSFIKENYYENRLYIFNYMKTLG